MIDFISRLTGRRGHDGPQVERTVCVIGDVHGRRDLLKRLLDRIAAELPDAVVVTVGDYVDRGPDSRGVLDLLGGQRDVVALRGNHEDMMLSFLDAPVEEGPLWLFNGGVQTLESYGITGVSERSPAPDLARASAALTRALGPRRMWLDQLPLTWSTGNLLVSHAGADPSRAPDDQEAADVLWGHPNFGKVRRRDGIWVVHGHWIVERPFVAGGRIATDTGAWFSDRLTAAVIAPDAPVRFLHT